MSRVTTWDIRAYRTDVRKALRIKESCGCAVCKKSAEDLDLINMVLSWALGEEVAEVEEHVKTVADYVRNRDVYRDLHPKKDAISSPFSVESF